MDFDLVQATEKHGAIYKITTKESNIDVYYRLVTKREYDTFNALCDKDGTTFAAEDYLIKTAVVFPTIESLDDSIYAGETNFIAEEIAKNSGFFDFKQFFNAVTFARQQCQILSEQIIIFIAKAMPVYKIDEIENMNYIDQARLLAMSEVILGTEMEMGVKPTRGNLLDKTPVDQELTPEQKKTQEKITSQALGALQAIRERR
jgi:hypothetical protein